MQQLCCQAVIMVAGCLSARSTVLMLINSKRLLVLRVRGSQLQGVTVLRM